MKAGGHSCPEHQRWRLREGQEGRLQLSGEAQVGSEVALRPERVECSSGTGGRNQEDPLTTFMRKTLGATTPLPTAHSAAECPSPQKTRCPAKP